VPPALTVVGPTEPVPPKVPPELMNTGETIEPFTLRMPPSTLVGPA